MSGKPINLDADPENADWIKTLSWDLPRDAETFIRTELGDGTPDQQRANLAAFLRLPAAEAMPPELRDELVSRGVLPSIPRTRLPAQSLVATERSIEYRRLFGRRRR